MNPLLNKAHTGIKQTFRGRSTMGFIVKIVSNNNGNNANIYSNVRILNTIRKLSSLVLLQEKNLNIFQVMKNMLNELWNGE